MADPDAATEQAADSGPVEHSARVPFVVLLLALLGGGLCALLALNTATAASEVRQRRLDTTNATLNDREQQLSRDVAELQAPSALARRAAALGLVPADSPAFLRVNADGSVTLLGAPAPATTQPPPAPPAPTATATPTKPASTPTAKPTKSAKPTPGRATSTKSAPGQASAATKPAPKPSATATKPKLTPKPTRTPTPTVTLPGGPR